MIFASCHHAISPDGMWIWKNRALKNLGNSQKLLTNVTKSMLHTPIIKNQTVTMRAGLMFPVSRANRVLIRMTKGFLYTLYPDVNRYELQFNVEMLMPTQAIIDDLYRTLAADERGNGIFRFWHGVSKDDTREGVWVYVFYNGMAFYVTHNPLGGNQPIDFIRPKMGENSTAALTG